MNRIAANRGRGLLSGVIAGLLLGAGSAQAVTLQEAIAHTIETNPEVLIGLNRFRAGKEQIAVENAGFLPKIDLDASYGLKKREYDLGSTNEDSDDKIFETGFSLQQKLFDGYKTKYRVKSARHMNDYRSILLRETAQSVALRVAEVYLKVLRAQQLVELARENLAVHDEIYDQTFQKAGSGLARNSDLEQIRSRRARASANLVNAINGISNARSEFFSIANIKPKSLVMPQLDTSLLPMTLEDAMSVAGQHNPAIRASGVEVLAMEARAKSSESYRWPTVNLELDKTWNDTNSDIAATDGKTDDLGVMVNLSYSLYSGGANSALKREAFYQVEEARAVRDLQFREVMKEVRLAWDGYVYMAGRMNYLKEHVEASREVAREYQQQFRLGKRSLLDLLDTENELFQAQQDFISVVHDELYSRYRILKNTGKLLETLNISLPHTMRERLDYVAGRDRSSEDELRDWIDFTADLLPDL